MSMIGKTLGSFECNALLGRGGMGDVYQAKDQKLGRDVAIKVLPEEFARDGDRLARFQREAKLLASLNHPNIASIHGLEESGGTHFLILELIEGDTLADQIRKGPIPVEKALKLALQIAEALDAAHEKGVIHRDLKPSNIKITPEGKIKVLDFGLAKAFAGEKQEIISSDSPTLSVAATQNGVILGTAAYMSPEQAKGKTIDKRTDIWSFGAVLYEMLTGQPAFQGEDIPEILASVVKASVNLNLLPPNIHPRVREIIFRCLQKEQKRRYSGIGDVQYEIEQVMADPSGLFVDPVTIAKQQKRLRLVFPWIAAAFALGLIIAGLVVWNIKPSESRPITSFIYEIPEEHEFSGLNLNPPMLAISPDGRKFAYCTPRGIYLRYMYEMEAKIIPGTDEVPQQPFFSPDGEWIGYWSQADRQLKKIHTSGEMPISLSDIEPLGYLSWNTDDTIIFSGIQGIVRISAQSGESEILIKVENEPFFTPRFLPDGKTLIFTLSRDGEYKVVAQALESGEQKVLTSGSDAYYYPTGHLVYMFNKNLCTIPFDLERLETTGGPIPRVKDILRTTGAPQFALAPSGTLVYLKETANEAPYKRTLHWVSRNGVEESLGAQPDSYNNPRISPDGTKVALGVGSQSTYNLKVWDLVRKQPNPLTFEESINSLPIWTADGQSIVFFRQGEANLGIHRMAAEGAGIITDLFIRQREATIPECWIADEKTLLVTITPVGSNDHDIGMLSMVNDSEWELQPLLQEEHSELQPQISPNGQWMAFTSNKSGNYEIWVCPFPNVDLNQRQVSINGGDSPLWSPDGRELFYRSGDEVMAIPIKMEPSFSPGKPISLFQDTYVPADTWIGSLELHPWDINPSGQHFLMMRGETGSGASVAGGTRKINIIQNWSEELNERVPD